MADLRAAALCPVVLDDNCAPRLFTTEQRARGDFQNILRAPGDYPLRYPEAVDRCGQSTGCFARTGVDP